MSAEHPALIVRNCQGLRSGSIMSLRINCFAHLGHWDLKIALSFRTVAYDIRKTVRKYRGNLQGLWADNQIVAHTESQFNENYCFILVSFPCRTKYLYAGKKADSYSLVSDRILIGFLHLCPLPPLRCQDLRATIRVTRRHVWPIRSLPFQHICSRSFFFLLWVWKGISFLSHLPNKLA